MASYQRISLNALKDRATERVGNNTVFWVGVEKGYAVNEAIKVWAALTGQWARPFPLPSVAGAIFYDVPKQVVSLQRIRYGTTLVEPTSLFDLDNMFSGWQDTAAGTPLFWAPVGLNHFAFYPPSNGGVNLQLEGVASAPQMVAGGDNVDLGDEDIGPLLDYAHHYLSFKEGGQEFASTQPLFENFMQAAVKRNGRLKASGLFRAYIGQVTDQGLRRPEVDTSPGARAS